ncbi:MAG TPA: PIN domain-containing protein [Gemmatimonadales bacterium]|nr:PIN domain-containing protein [Gemmatimonadales bacterium]
MIAYVDSSVVLRLVLGQPGALAEWRELDAGVASALAEVECLRTLDRLRLVQGLPEAEVARRRAAVFDVLETVEVVEPTRPILTRAAQPLPVTLGTLDAIHLATALVWREVSQRDVVLATHDARLALAARAVGFDTIGV